MIEVTKQYKVQHNWSQHVKPMERYVLTKFKSNYHLAGCINVESHGR